MKMIHPRTTTSFALLILLCAPACAPQELDQGSLLDGFRRDDDERARLERRVTALEQAIKALPTPRAFERSVALEQQHASMLVQIASSSLGGVSAADTSVVAFVSSLSLGANEPFWPGLPTHTQDIEQFFSAASAEGPPTVTISWYEEGSDRNLEFICRVDAIAPVDSVD